MVRIMVIQTGRVTQAVTCVVTVTQLKGVMGCSRPGAIFITHNWMCVVCSCVHHSQKTQA